MRSAGRCHEGQRGPAVGHRIGGPRPPAGYLSFTHRRGPKIGSRAARLCDEFTGADATARPTVHRGDRPPESSGGRRTRGTRETRSGSPPPTPRTRNGATATSSSPAVRRSSSSSAANGSASSTTRSARTCGRSRAIASPCGFNTRAGMHPASGGAATGTSSGSSTPRDTCAGARPASTTPGSTRPTAAYSGRARTPSAICPCRWHDRGSCLLLSEILGHQRFGWSFPIRGHLRTRGAAQRLRLPCGR
jgi:hypothetical protein